MEALHPVRVHLIEPYRMLQWGLQQLLKARPLEMAIAGTSFDAGEAMESIEQTTPDIILANLEACSENIADLASFAHAKVLVYTRRDDQDMQDRAIFDGAHGVLDSGAPPEIFQEAIIKVHQGQIWLDRAATGRIFVELSRKKAAASAEESRLSGLTNREKKVILCIFDNPGISGKAIADKLFISESTLRNHLTSIYSKLGVANRLELISSGINKELSNLIH